MPGEAGMPSRIKDTLVLSEPVVDQLDQLGERVLRIITRYANRDLGATLRGQHHHAHDAFAVDLEVVLAHPDFRLEYRRELDELRSRTRVQPVLVFDLDRLLNFSRRR